MNRIVPAALAGTTVFAVVSIAAAVSDADAVVVIAVVIDLVLFVAGCAAFVVALLAAAARSRTDELHLPGLFWLSGTAPFDVRIRLLGALTVEIAVALGTASARPFTGLAFGVLVPVYGLGLTGLWGARLGVFGPRV